MVDTTAAVKIEGLPELRRALRQLEPQLRREFRAQTFRKVAQLVASDAKPFAPARTGRLRDSIRGGSSGDRAVIRSSRPYANFIYWGGTTGRGHSRHHRGSVRLARRSFTLAGQTILAAHPFVHQAMDRDRERVGNAFVEAVVHVARANGWKVTR